MIGVKIYGERNTKQNKTLHGFSIKHEILEILNVTFNFLLEYRFMCKSLIVSYLLISCSF